MVLISLRFFYLLFLDRILSLNKTVFDLWKKSSKLKAKLKDKGDKAKNYMFISKLIHHHYYICNGKHRNYTVFL